MVESSTVLIQKDVTNGSVVGIERPTDCLECLWKLLAGIIADKVHNHLAERYLLPEE